MEIISIHGRVTGACERKTDRKGHTFLRFKVACDGEDFAGRPRVTLYRCFTYNTRHDGLRDGDGVIVSGTLIVSEYNGRCSLDICVTSLTALPAAENKS